MNVYENLDINTNLDNNPDITCIGAFDGVHLGHMELIKFAKTVSSKYQILTFDPIPKKYFNNEHELLSTKQMKINILSKNNPESIIFLSFENIKELSPLDFCNILSEKLNTSAIVVGRDFKFGKDRVGDVKFLIKYFGKSNVHVLNDYEVNNLKVSSTLIKSSISDGKIDLANKLLGYTFSLKGKVIHGSRMGHSIGFPTANMKIDKELVIPKFGVYEVIVIIKEKKYKGLMNIGKKPTVSEEFNLSHEVHILDFNEDIYDSIIEVELQSFIREEIKFENINQLKAQIAIDIKSIKNK
jgi:riboflavin kinase/FMN adenylyltransferase